jgi:pilus assembly protein FimV
VWVLGTSLALSPLLTHALGLGRIKVHSALNEPLNAEIELTSLTDRELKGLVSTVASRGEFDAAGVEYLPYLTNIKFTVGKRLDGRPVLQLTTDQPIEEPFLHMLVQVEWPGGRLVREYSALIDPPAQMFAKPAGIQPPAVPPQAKAPEPAPVEVPPAPSAPAVVPVEPIKVEPAREEQVAAVVPPPAPAEPVAPQAAPKEPSQPEAPQAKEGFAAAPTPTEERLLGPSVPPVAETAPTVEPLAPTAEAPREPAAQPAAAPPVAAAGAPSWANVPEYTVKPGDTLWEIADKVRAEKHITIEQTMLAIFKNNGDAFFGNNVNNLSAGKILRMPERDAVEGMPAELARIEFRAQYDAWQEYKLKLAAGSHAVKVPETAEPAATAPAPAAEAPAQKPSAEAGKKPDELLKIVRADLKGEKGTPEKKVAETESAKEASERQALADRVTTLEESLVSRQLEAKELSDRIGAVRNQLKRESRLIAIESQQLAQAQQKAKPAEEVAAKPQPKPEAKPAEAPKAEAPKVEEKPKEPVAVKKEPPKRVAPPPPPPVEEEGFITGMFNAMSESGLLLPLLGVVVVASGGLGFLYWRRRRKAIGEFEESILQSETATGEASASASELTGQPAPTGDTSFLSDFSQAGVGTAHVDEVDPAAEAEVYLAYGRDETAEDILKDAIVKNPERNDLKVKLLEIYLHRNDPKAFETLAEEVYAALGGRRDKLWEKVEEMGRKLVPDNPMFRGGGPARTAETAAPKPFGETMPGLAAAAAAGTPAAGGLDFDLAAPEPSAKAAKPLDFDMDLGGAASVATTEEEGAGDFGLAAAQPSGADTGLESLDLGQPASSSVIDFDLGAPAEAAPAAAAGPALSEPTGGGDLDIDLGDMAAPAAAAEASAGAAPAGQWDETATKLDLAKAYIDMGDAEGARSILDEVMNEGNDDQKRQAKELAAQIV